MQLVHQKSVCKAQLNISQINGLAWAPDNSKLAVCDGRNHVFMYDPNGDEKDKFNTKPLEPTTPKDGYVATAIAFSEDSTRLAIAQSDNVVFVYKIGLSFGEKKAIVNKYVQTEPCTSMIFTITGNLIFGLYDGKVRLATGKTRSGTLYSVDSPVVAIACNPKGTCIVSAHQSGVIARYQLDAGGGMPSNAPAITTTSQIICTHPCPAFALACTDHSIMAAGADARVIAYTTNGEMLQQFDYSRQQRGHAFNRATTSPSGHAVIVCGYDNFRIYSWSSRRGVWDETRSVDIANYYSITAVAWKYDGTKIAIGSATGAVDLFEVGMRKAMYKDKYEIAYIGPSQVTIRDVENQVSTAVRSAYDCEIETVQVIGVESNYFALLTSETLIICSANGAVRSEVPWTMAGGREQYHVDEFLGVAAVFSAGELVFIELGSNQILTTVRTEHVHPRLWSVRLGGNRKRGVASGTPGRLAYLVDRRTICVVDVRKGTRVAEIVHDSKIDWLELSETSEVVVFRDKKMRLMRYDLKPQAQSKKSLLLSYSPWVQLVDGSDVLVAQGYQQMCVWYNIVSAPDKKQGWSIKGDITEIQRNEGKHTEVLVKEGPQIMAYPLDDTMIEFGTAVEDGDYARAAFYLESQGDVPEAMPLWKTLADNVVRTGDIALLERCYAAIGDVSKVRYLHSINRLKEDGNPAHEYKIAVRLALLDGDFAQAERICLEHDDAAEAIDIYRKVNMWTEAIQLAKARHYPQTNKLVDEYYQWLMDTRQESLAAKMKEQEGSVDDAYQLAVKSGAWYQAAQLLVDHPGQLLKGGSRDERIQEVTRALVDKDMLEQVGWFQEELGNKMQAFDYFRKASAFHKAMRLARTHFPDRVVALEEEWGDHLYDKNQLDAAIGHYIEAGCGKKALDAAMKGGHWRKAAEIADSMAQANIPQEYYAQLAEQFVASREFRTAEEYFFRGGRPEAAVTMYLRNVMFSDAYRVANEALGAERMREVFLEEADKLVKAEKLREAEHLYAAMKEPDLAMAMYRKTNDTENLLRVIKQHAEPQQYEEACLRIAMEKADEQQLDLAEKYYLEAGRPQNAIKMYLSHDNYEDAFRIAKTNAGGDKSVQTKVLYLWATHVGGDAAVKLVQKIGSAKDVLDLALDNDNFKLAFALCDVTAPERKNEVHFAFGRHLMQEDRLAEAEEQFLNADRPADAITMYAVRGIFDKAQELAAAHDQSFVPRLQELHAESYVKEGDYRNAEALFLRLKKFDKAVEMYKSADMWQEALRVCRDYAPHLLQQVEYEYDRNATRIASNSVRPENLLRQAKELEQNGQYHEAVMLLIKVADIPTADPIVIDKSLMNAARLAVKFLGETEAQQRIQQIGPRLMNAGLPQSAARVYMGINMRRQALESLMDGGLWDDARGLAGDLGDADLVAFVDDKYKDSLKRQGDADELAAHDPTTAMMLYAERGQFEQCLALAARQGDEKLLHKYVAQYADKLLRSSASSTAATEKQPGKSTLDAVKLYLKYGVPAYTQNYNLYRRMFVELVGNMSLSPSSTQTVGDTAAAYEAYAALRDMFYVLQKNFSNENAAEYKEFHRLLLVSHWYAARCAYSNIEELMPLSDKISLALLRYADIIPADKAFYEAGLAARRMGEIGTAFVLFNVYVDFVDAINDADPSLVSYPEDFSGSDVPSEVPLPEKACVSTKQHEEIKDWVIQTSMQPNLEAKLKLNNLGVFEVSLDAGRLAPCFLTAYPVGSGNYSAAIDGGNGKPVEIGRARVLANKDDYNKFVIASKSATSFSITDFRRFVRQYCQVDGDLEFVFS